MNAIKAMRIALDRIERRAASSGVEPEDIASVTAPRRAVEALAAVYGLRPDGAVRITFPRLLPGWHCDVTPDDSDA